MSSASIARRPDIAGSILVIGGVTYAFLCAPAITRRGYPPIDPIWLGVIHLWIAPVCLSALFDSFSLGSRRYHLAIYAYATAFVMAGTGTMHGVTPGYVDVFSKLLLTAILYGPMHLLGTLGAEGLMQLVLRRSRTIVDATDNAAGFPRITLLSWLVGFSIICLSIGVPFSYRSLSIARERANGTFWADQDWASGRACLFQKEDDIRKGGTFISYRVDPDTGLMLQHKHPDWGFCDAYNSRIAELIQLQGLPDGSLKNHVPSADDLVTLLHADDLLEITSFPHDVTPGILLMRRGTITRWGRTITSDGESLLIATEREGTIGVGEGEHPVHVRISDPIVVIRNGTNWVGVFHKDGRMIVTCSR